MKQTFTQEQIVATPPATERGTSVTACRKAGITEQTFYRVLRCGWTPGNASSRAWE